MVGVGREVEKPPRLFEGRYDVTGYPQMAIVTPPGRGAVILAMGTIPGRYGPIGALHRHQCVSHGFTGS